MVCRQVAAGGSGGSRCLLHFRSASGAVLLFAVLHKLWKTRSSGWAHRRAGSCTGASRRAPKCWRTTSSSDGSSGPAAAIVQEATDTSGEAWRRFKAQHLCPAGGNGALGGAGCPSRHCMLHCIPVTRHPTHLAAIRTCPRLRGNTVLGARFRSLQRSGGSNS